ncbi:hypothetical protein GCM10008965_56790 [Methylorubrum aminovorans]|nr:hypothetical protein GCM10025880_31190 [Methylorubrum aminovorans]
MAFSSAGSLADTAPERRLSRKRADTKGDPMAAFTEKMQSGWASARYNEGPEIRAAKVALAKVLLCPLDSNLVHKLQH